MKTIAVVACLMASTAVAIAKAHNPKPWPVSQCGNGWVDRMTGMCPYRSGRSRSRF